MNHYKNIEDLFPYVEHSLRTICKSVLAISQFYSSRIFSSVKVEGLDKIKDFKTQYPDSNFIYVSRHRSHLDYFETQLALGKAHMPTRIQAGDNLFIGPFDPILRETGAFMVVRGERGFYSKNWLLDMMYSALPSSIGPYNKQYEVYIGKKLSKLLYESYLEHILREREHSNDLLVYPEYIREGGKLKYGRSYSGKLLDFSPYIFILLRRITSKLDKRFFFVPVNPSYERIIEDSFITKIPDLKERFSRDFVYLKEFAYIATRGFFPFFRRGKFVLKFGEPSEVEKPENVKVAAASDSKKLKHDVGLLETPSSPQIIFYSMGSEQKVDLPTLEDRVMSNTSKLEESKVDTSQLKSDGSAKKFDVLLEETLRLFDAPGRRYVKAKGNSFEVVDARVISQYANHIKHLF